MDYLSLRKQAAYLTVLCDCHDAAEAGKALVAKEPEPAQDIEAQKVAFSNIILGGNGVKAELVGDTDTEPTAKIETLTAVGFDEREAQEMIDEGVKIRADAWALRVTEAPREIIEEKP